jgi:hypothetical protein
MARIERLTRLELRRFSRSPIKCPRANIKIRGLADYFATISTTITTDESFWFRGHSDVSWSLTPHALRFSSLADREKALGLLSEFKRVAELKLPRPPHMNEELRWIQLAQHFGLPTRLLDWTESATTALFFACSRFDRDGFVFILDPVGLNRLSYPRKPRILDPQNDDDTIQGFLHLGANKVKRGKLPIAINPVWNSERLMIQKGVFTLHGSKFDLDDANPRELPLVAVPILGEAKRQLRSELQRVGVDEMTIFPELEHACSHLRCKSGLAEWQ